MSNKFLLLYFYYKFKLQMLTKANLNSELVLVHILTVSSVTVVSPCAILPILHVYL